MSTIVGKQWDPGILDPSPFLAKIRKVEARLGKFIQKIGKLEVRPHLASQLGKLSQIRSEN